MVHNTTAVTELAEENQTVDETSWPHCGYGEAGSGICGRLKGKKVPKGGQTVLMSDSSRFRPHAYVHRHKLHPKEDGLTRGGTVELRDMILQIDKMLIGYDGRSANNNTDTTMIINEDVINENDEGETT